MVEWRIDYETEADGWKKTFVTSIYVETDESGNLIFHNGSKLVPVAIIGYDCYTVTPVEEEENE